MLFAMNQLTFVPTHSYSASTTAYSIVAQPYRAAGNGSDWPDWAPPGFATRAEMIQARTDDNTGSGKRTPVGMEEGTAEKASWSHDNYPDGFATGTNEKAGNSHVENV